MQDVQTSETRPACSVLAAAHCSGAWGLGHPTSERHMWSCRPEEPHPGWTSFLFVHTTATKHRDSTVEPSQPGFQGTILHQVDPRILLKDLDKKAWEMVLFSTEKIDSLSSYIDIYERFLRRILLNARSGYQHLYWQITAWTGHSPQDSHNSTLGYAWQTEVPLPQNSDWVKTGKSGLGKLNGVNNLKK